MFSRIVPWNSHVSWRTIPNVDRSSSRDIARLSMPSIVIRPLVDLVEPHQQVDQGRLAGAGRSDDGDHLARLHDEVEVLDERHLGQVAERHVLELDAPGDGRPRPDELDLAALLALVEELEDPLGRGDRRTG